LRPGAAQLTQVLRDADRRVIVLSGDAEEPVRSIARTLGIDTWRSRMSPEGKHAFVAGLQVPGSVIATVGDGLNDAPVLAQSHVSIAMGEGAALAQAHADIVLLNNDIASLGEAIRIAQRCMRIVRQNLAWAVAYNLVALPLAIGGFLTPWIAGIGMAASSTLVVLNALRVAPMRSKRPARRAASGAVVLGKAAV
jgi:Cu2+-exporting ATPase